MAVSAGSPAFPYADVEKMVEIIGKQPFIYDPTRDDHKDQHKMDNAWRSIAEHMEKSLLGDKLFDNPL